MNRLKIEFSKDKRLYEIAGKRNCTGCGACASTCPRECIQMVENEEGFPYPLIDHTKCIRCGICLRNCPAEPEDDEKIQAVLAGYSRNPDIQRASSSGGIFTHLAEAVLKKNGIVFGVTMEGDRATTREIENVGDIPGLRGSKYVQSCTEKAYRHVVRYLEEGRWVLFSGTPCQIAGLHSVLKKGYSRLITVDFICHGISSPAVLRKYLSETGKGKQANNISFRDKSNGWRKFSMKVSWADKSVSCVPMTEDIYLQSFLKNLNLRPSCFSCRFRKIHRTSDITLGDLWGSEKIAENWTEDLGYSLIIIQSMRGVEMWNEIKDQVISTPVELSRAMEYNSSLKQSPWDEFSRDLFFKYLPDHDLQYCIDKATKDGPMKRAGRKIWKLLVRKNEK